MKNIFSLLVMPLSLVWSLSSCQTALVRPSQDAVTWENRLGARQFYLAEPVIAAIPNQPHPSKRERAPLRYSGLWANRTNFNLWQAAPGQWTAGPEIQPPGFIEESNPTNIPTYAFVGPEWQRLPEAMQAKKQIRAAFREWSSLEAGPSPVTGRSLVTGLSFLEANHAQGAEIHLLWKPLPGTGVAGLNRSIRPNGQCPHMELTFDSTAAWWFGTGAMTPLDRMHFYSTALHETGHIVGLWESADPSCVMIHERGLGPHGPTFDHLDERSKRMALALYSLPVVQLP